MLFLRVLKREVASCIFVLFRTHEEFQIPGMKISQKGFFITFINKLVDAQNTQENGKNCQVSR